MVPSSLLLGMPLASKESVMLTAIIYTKPGPIMFIIYILVMVGIKGQQNNHLHSIFKVG